MEKLATRHLATVNARWVSLSHTACAIAAFGSAFLATLFLHYSEAVKNEYFEFPYEWFPTVAAATGERYPERYFFQLFIAVAAGPRLLLVGLWYLLVRTSASKLPFWYLVLGLLRTAACGGFVYIPSMDDHEFHDTMVISYGLLTAGWMVSTTYFTLNSRSEQARRYRRRLTQAFVLMFVPLGHYFIQHRLYQKSGSMSMYALCEWILVGLDVAFDSVSIYEFEGLDIEIAGPSTALPF